MITVDSNTDFSIENIPFGIASKSGNYFFVAIAYGQYVLDLSFLAKNGLFDSLEIDNSVFTQIFLNDFIALGKSKTSAVRKEIQKFLIDPDHKLWKNKTDFLFFQNSITLHLPIRIGDYTDFYSSEAHAQNVGMMFRDPENALLPNWKHLPVGYHGRASSIFVSGTNFKRPKGQILPPGVEKPVFSSTQKLDFELEMAAVIGKNSTWQEPVDVNEASDYVFGFVMFNDWSARDIQKWEYVPLGPFLSKSFFSSISPWVVTADALESFKVKSKNQDPKPLEYLTETDGFQYDVKLKVYFKTAQGQTKLISESNYKNLYWTIAQQIAHHTINGCNLKVGDLLASGTISGDTPDSLGSLLEISWGGKNPIIFKDGTTRTFVEDGDSIIFEAFAEKKGYKVGFGTLINTCLPQT